MSQVVPGQEIAGYRIGALGLGEGAVWVGTGRSTIVRIDVPEG